MKLKLNKFKILIRVVCILTVLTSIAWSDWIDLTGDVPVRREFDPDEKPHGPTMNVQAKDALGNDIDRTDWSNSRTYTVTISVPGIWVTEVVEDGETYSKLDVPGNATQYTELGRPAVPFEVVKIKIPSNTNPQVSVSTVNEITIGGMNISPAQPMSIDTVGWEPGPFRKDTDVYNSDQLYPQTWMLRSSVNNMLGHRIAVIEVPLVQVKPLSQTMVIASTIELEIELIQRSDYTEPAKKAAWTPEKYLILMDDQFDGNQKLNDEFITWKTRKGYEVIKLLTSEIPPYNGAPNKDDIYNFLITYYNSTVPKYLLIIGDHDDANGVAPCVDNDNGYYLTDLHYVSDIGTIDRLPDLYYGRLPASDNAELNLMLEKVISMDHTPPTSPDMYNKVIVASEITLTPDETHADASYIETADAVSCYLEENDDTQYNCVRAWQKNDWDDVTGNTIWNEEIRLLWKGANSEEEKITTRVSDEFVSKDEAVTLITDNINSGSAILFHRDHGDVDRFVRPLYRSVQEVRELRNGNNLPLVLSLNCSSGKYDYGINCFARTWLNHANGGGAHAVFAPTKRTLSECNEYFSHGLFGALFGNWYYFFNRPESRWPSQIHEPSEEDRYLGLVPGDAKKLGQMIHFGKMYVYDRYGDDCLNKTIAKYHCFGDPEADVILKEPENISVSIPDIIPYNSTTTLNFSTGENNLLICLYNQALNIHMAQMTNNGEAVFDIFPEIAGNIDVTITGFGKRPFEDAIQVQGEGPQDLYIQNRYFDRYAKMVAKRNIYAGPAVDVLSPNANVTFVAGNEIHLEDGFEVKPGAEFHAYIE